MSDTASVLPTMTVRLLYWAIWWGPDRRQQQVQARPDLPYTLPKVPQPCLIWPSAGERGRGNAIYGGGVAKRAKAMWPCLGMLWALASASNKSGANSRLIILRVLRGAAETARGSRGRALIHGPRGLAGRQALLQQLCGNWQQCSGHKATRLGFFFRGLAG